jgi:hypothetical protein
MNQILMTIVQLGTGVFWCAAYILIIKQGYRDKSSGMPMAALCANISWEFIFSFVYPHKGLQGVINIMWFTLDIIIVLQYFNYGRKEFWKDKPLKIFYSVFSFTVILSFSVIMATVAEFKDFEGKYAAFSQNLMMSILFVLLLLKRRNTKGQSIYIALFKMIGSVIPAIGLCIYYRSGLIAVLSLTTLLFDLLYTLLLNNKLHVQADNTFGGFDKQYRRVIR